MVEGEEDYDTGVGPAGRGRYDQRGHPPRSHVERGRPPPPPHPHRQQTRGGDPRDPHYRDNHPPYGPHGPRGVDRRDGRDMRDPQDPRDRYDDRHPREYGRGGDRGRDQHTRIFVALFDYDPPTMSPNPDACEEELGFREGQLIKVFGDKDPDGFYWGEASGRAGYVPGNMVSEVQVSVLLSSFSLKFLE